VKITLTCDDINEANGVLLALGKLPLEVVGPLYLRFQQQIVEQTRSAQTVLGVPNTPPNQPLRKKPAKRK
jgi:hypothetical protein